MAENKTRPTDVSVDDYIASRANAQQRTDCRELMALFKKVTGHPPKMWGPSIVGYGRYRYTYESGRTGEGPLAGFAIRGRELVVYLEPDAGEQKSLLSRLGKHKMGKTCLYFKQLADLDGRRSKSSWSIRSRRQGGAMRRAMAPKTSRTGEAEPWKALLSDMPLPNKIAHPPDPNLFC